jgi:hypothetical protein
MSLANRLSAVIPNRSNRGGCITCRWVDDLPASDRQAWDQWIEEKRSLSQLWEISSRDPDNPYPVSLTALRYHVRTHKDVDES